MEDQILRRLILLRHMKSDRPKDTPDHERPLAERGRRTGPIIGAYMAQAGLLPDFAIVSTALRTQQTWELVAPAFPAAVPAANESRVYEAPARQLLSVLREAPDDKRTVVLVGHNPGLEDLANMLIGTGASADLLLLREKYPTGGLAVVDFDISSWKDLAKSTGHLERFVTPRSVETPS